MRCVGDGGRLSTSVPARSLAQRAPTLFSFSLTICSRPNEGKEGEEYRKEKERGSWTEALERREGNRKEQRKLWTEGRTNGQADGR